MPSNQYGGFLNFKYRYQFKYTWCKCNMTHIEIKHDFLIFSCLNHCLVITNIANFSSVKEVTDYIEI